MQRGLWIVAGAGVVTFGCFLVLKRAVDIGINVPDVVLAATAATLVLAAASVVFSVWAVASARQARAETARLARSLEAAFRGSSRAEAPIRIGADQKWVEDRRGMRPYLVHAEPVRPLASPAAAAPANRHGWAGRRH